MPDGTIVPAAEEDKTVYTAGIYRGTVSILPNGSVPDYPAGSDTGLPGACYDAETEQQDSVLTLHISVTPYTVTFDAGEGTLNGQQKVVLQNQFKYPDLTAYVPQSGDPKLLFTGWLEGGQQAHNQAGGILSGDVTYTAVYSDDITVSGQLCVGTTYEQNGQTVYIKDTDRLTRAVVVLQKRVGDIYNDLAAQTVEINYAPDAQGIYDVGAGVYQFANLPNDGSEYRVQILALNFTHSYDSNADGAFDPEECIVIANGTTARAQVDIDLALNPDCYQQGVLVDASRIGEDYRPTDALVQILYRDLGDVHHYQIISQHDVGNMGIPVQIDPVRAQGVGFEDIWNWHTNGTLYEYQMQLAKLYGNVDGAYTSEGTPYTKDSPYTVQYGPSNHYIRQTTQGGVMLEATLIPKEYAVLFDLNLEGASTDSVQGMNDFMVDDGTGNDRFVYIHTWSHADKFTAFPYREGYVFKGWVSSDEESVVVVGGGNIHVGAEMAKTVTLTAQWDALTGTDYTVRHLELNTDKVLHGAQTVTDAAQGSSVAATDVAMQLDGYAYAGAWVNGTYYDKTENPYLVVSTDPLKNLMVVYYLPDGSDGYTEQVESNLHIHKDAVLEDDGTYTITLNTYTMDNPITTYIQQNTPLDIVMVMDQSGSIINSGYLDKLKAAMTNFITEVADHGRTNEVDHRIAIVGYAGDDDEPPTSDNTDDYPIAGGNTTNWVNTGVFDSNGDFHPYPVTGFHYTECDENPVPGGIYYTYSDGEYLLLTYHQEYRHLITEYEANQAVLEGEQVYGYTNGQFVALTRNSSGLWLYADKQLYSMTEFFTYHTDVWTHRKGLERRQIHAYGTGDSFTCSDGHDSLFVREETQDANPELNVYKDALIPVSVGANGSGGVNHGLVDAADRLGSNGGTFVQYGIEMANRVFEANPLDPNEGRVRIMVMFTDGLPGIGTFDATVANEAIEQAYISKNTHNAYSYTIGLYDSQTVAAASDQEMFMNAVSSNYPKAQSLEDIRASLTYTQAADGTALKSDGSHYVLYNGTYYPVKYGYVQTSGSFWSRYCWYYTRGNTNYSISTASSPTVSGGKVGSFTIYEQSGGYKDAEKSGYYATTDSADQLNSYFENVLRDITTKITQEIILHEDTILRDIMGQGLVLTPGTQITAYKVPGAYDPETEQIIWSDEREKVAWVTVPEKPDEKLFSEQTTTMQYTLDDGTPVVKENVPYISVYNLTAQNATNPDGANYHPHAVDITGYDFDEWYICENHPNGFKMEVTITRVEARDNVQWGRAVNTNNAQSGLWLPADAQGNRELLLPFEQPTTIFVERAYVLDYGKEFTLDGWYFDDAEGRDANPVHVDCDIQSGMNWFDPRAPHTTNAIANADNQYGNTKYGNVRIEDGRVKYQPVTTNWEGMDQFYVFGDTWRKTVLAQNANENGNLWNKVSVIPANNVYFEDSFITKEDTDVNGFRGFTFTGDWSVVYTGENSNNAGLNTEIPEHLEGAPYGDVHGWTDALGDDWQYSDGSAHATGLDGKTGASAEFTFTGTGVDVYTRTNSSSGMVVALLYRVPDQTDGDNAEPILHKSLAMDNLAVSGDYYQIPTVSFTGLSYGTYTVRLIATASSVATDTVRTEYYLDGIRIYNPMGSVLNDASIQLKEAYGKELNAVFTEIRDVLLKYDDFNTGIPDDAQGKMGAVFIDWIQDGQESGEDQAGTGQPTYEVGTTFLDYGPKNEVYLSQGQAVVLKVDPANTYYVGMKTLNLGDKATGEKAAVANVSGIDQATPTRIEVGHTTDMYYQVTPIDGYIVIQNGAQDGAILALTKLRTTNMYANTTADGILPVQAGDAVRAVTVFTQELERVESASPGVSQKPEEPPKPVLPEKPDASAQVQKIRQLTDRLFAAVRTWLDNP